MYCMPDYMFLAAYVTVLGAVLNRDAKLRESGECLETGKNGGN